jgi:hypothetical protein
MKTKIILGFFALSTILFQNSSCDNSNAIDPAYASLPEKEYPPNLVTASSQKIIFSLHDSLLAKKTLEDMVDLGWRDAQLYKHGKNNALVVWPSSDNGISLVGKTLWRNGKAYDIWEGNKDSYIETRNEKSAFIALKNANQYIAEFLKGMGNYTMHEMTITSVQSYPGDEYLWRVRFYIALE